MAPLAKLQCKQTTGHPASISPELIYFLIRLVDSSFPNLDLNLNFNPQHAQTRTSTTRTQHTNGPILFHSIPSIPSTNVNDITAVN